MKRISISETANKAGEKVTLCGWVHTRRDHGKLIFIDLRDRSGIIQIVFTPDKKEFYETANKVRPEWVLRVAGTVSARPEKMFNNEIPTGKIELQPESVEILSEALTPPFALDTNGLEIGEENRMKYRYLDLRRDRMKNNMIMRHRVIKFFRDYLDKEGFVEIETPLLTKSTPEGARDYVVPSRLHPGEFFALPQSPQQYKQLLMVAGFEKYFQIARCFRDEDTRGDRQPEFTQLDMEMSFVEREDVMDITESLFIETVEKLFPEKKITQKPFPRLSYREAMEKYGSDKPDLRKNKTDSNELSFAWITDFPFFEPSAGSGQGKTDKGGWTFTHNPFSAPKKEHMGWLLEGKNIGEILTTQYDLALNGFEIGGGSIRNHRPEALKAVFKIMGFSDEEIEKGFGHMLRALEFGAPPHGGIAPGIDRFLMVLMNEPNIREVIAFPKTGDGRDLMMEAPSELSMGQLNELGLDIKKK
ncbi:MAG: aspartyl-tRNA synthetase [Parcubacteria group bacterium Licking1014_17]|nr:MAG: aspartyl-tRNA synthetase [Parcubacteria group bacterium Licking1014_17]